MKEVFKRSDLFKLDLLIADVVNQEKMAISKFERYDHIKPETKKVRRNSIGRLNNKVKYN